MRIYKEGAHSDLVNLISFFSATRVKA